ncbi:hypothetical protein KAR91_56410 [Candidatus Pacearchaeota archaeon]|nr:hypothetical protein [Candidatus Pacearchaeota archaeon]
MNIWQQQKSVIHSEQTIQRLLVHRFYSNCKYLVPNIHYQLGEADLLIVRRSGYAEEFEIKISTSDLRADLKKQRKHQQMALRFKSENLYRYMIPNKFSYVVTERVKYEDFNLPPYARLYVAHRGLRCIKAPEFIHKKKYKWDRKIATSCSFRLLKAYNLTFVYKD